MILDHFDHAFLINMDRDTERLALSLERLERVGMTAERLAAVVPEHAGAFNSIAERGCIESHRRAVVLAKERGYGCVLIFEDDIVFRDNFPALWLQISAELSKVDYELFYFYRWMSRAWKPWDLRIVPIEFTLCTHAYAIHSRFYDAALRIYEENDRRGNVADRIFNASLARIYAPTYNIIGQDAGDSRIDGSQKTRRWSAYTDRLPFVHRWIWY